MNKTFTRSKSSPIKLVNNRNFALIDRMDSMMSLITQNVDDYKEKTLGGE